MPLRLDNEGARGKGTHKGDTRGEGHPQGVVRGGGHPQGVPLRLDNTRGGGRAHGLPPRMDDGGAYTGGGHPQGVSVRLDDEGGAHGGEGTHKGCPYGWIRGARTRGGGRAHGLPPRIDDGGAYTGGGHPQGVPLLLRFGRGRAPIKGGPYLLRLAGFVQECNRDVWRRRRFGNPYVLRIQDCETAPERDAPRHETGARIAAIWTLTAAAALAGPRSGGNGCPRVRPELAARIVVYYH